RGPLAAGCVVVAGGGVEVRAVVDPVCALDAAERGRGGEGDLVGVDVAPAADVVVHDLDPRGLADQGADVPGGPVKRLGVRSGGAVHHLAVDQQVDAGFGVVRRGGGRGEDDVVDHQVAPARGAVVLVDHLDRGLPSLVLGHVPRGPVHVAAVLAGRGGHHAAVDQQVDGGGVRL